MSTIIIIHIHNSVCLSTPHYEHIIYHIPVVPIGNPVISAIPDASSYLEGTNVTLTCKVNGGKPLATLSWHCMATSVNSSVRNSNNVTEAELFLVMNSNLNSKSCVCMPRHPVPSYQKDAEIFFTVFCKCSNIYP